MRVFFTTLLVFFASLLVGEMAAQQVAVAVDATEEFILVFVGVFLVALVVTAAMLVAQMRSEPRRAAGAVARWGIVLLMVVAVGLCVLSFVMAGDLAMVRADMPIIAGLVLPGIVVVIVAWAVVRLRTPASPPPPPLRFGRS